ncbi:MAG: carboxypeptidase-like regulatory domain-containing protein [Cecembia sp.]
MKHLFSFFFSVIFTTMLYAQSSPGINQVSGMVKDEVSAVPNVYIFLKNHPDFNSLTDSNGAFKLRFPALLKNDTIIVSHVGYLKVEIPLESLRESSNTINLKNRTIELKEITVRPEENLLGEFLQKVIQNIPKNYPEKRHQMTGLYRKVSTNYEEFNHLVEAQILVEDIAYNKDVKGAKIKIQNFRASDDFAEIDSTYLLFLRKFRDSEPFTGYNVVPDNPIIQLYENNFIRKNYLQSSPLNIKGYSDEFFGSIETPVYQEFIGYEILDKDTIYTIAYGTTDPPIGTSYIKVNNRDFAVVEYQVTRYMDAERELYEQFLMKYRKFGEKYYPDKLVHKVIRFVNRDIGAHQMDIHTVWFDEVKTEKLKRIPYKEILKRDRLLEPNHFKYEQDFWENNAWINSHALDTAIIRSLERYRSLEEQFKSNAKD